MTGHYIGTKVIKAQPMTRAGYNAYRGWDLPADENGADDGYLVEYLDGGAPNHPRHAGYISWSPKAQFDAAYLPMGDVEDFMPHQQRVVGEFVQLSDKVGKLRTFVGGRLFITLPPEERAILREQLSAMESYMDVLAKRVARF